MAVASSGAIASGTHGGPDSGDFVWTKQSLKHSIRENLEEWKIDEFGKNMEVKNELKLVPG